MTEKKNDIAVCKYGEAVALLKENGNQYQVSTFGNDNDNNQMKFIVQMNLFAHSDLSLTTLCVGLFYILLGKYYNYNQGSLPSSLKWRP